MRFHHVALGDCIFSIAGTYRTNWRTIWHAPENADLRKRRVHPSILLKGDVVYVPAVRVRPRLVSAGQKNEYTLPGVEKPRLRLELHSNGAERKHQPFELVCGDQVVKGTTDERGRINVAIRPGLRRAYLVVGPDRLHLDLRLGHLDPLDTITGVQGRLEHLGWDLGNEYGKCGPRTTMAIQAIQKSHKLPETGRVDSQTLTILDALVVSAA